MTTQFQMQMDAPAILQHEARKKFEEEEQQQQQQHYQKWKPKENQNINNDNKGKQTIDQKDKDKFQSDKYKQMSDKEKQPQSQSQQQKNFVQIEKPEQKKSQAQTQMRVGLLDEEQNVEQTQDQKKAKAAIANTENTINEGNIDMMNTNDNLQQQQPKLQEQLDKTKVESLDFSNFMNIILSLFYMFTRQMLWKPLGFVSRIFISKRMFPEGFYYDKYLKPIAQFLTFRNRWKLFLVDRVLRGMKEFGGNMVQEYLLPPIKDHIHRMRQIDGIVSLFRYIFDVTLDIIIFICLSPLIGMALMLFSCVWMYRQYLKYKKNIFGIFF